MQVRADGAEQELKQLYSTQRDNDSTVAQLQQLLQAHDLQSLADLQAALHTHQQALNAKDNAVAEAKARADGSVQAMQDAQDQLDVARSDLQEERRKSAALTSQVTELAVAEHTASTQERLQPLTSQFVSRIVSANSASVSNTDAVKPQLAGLHLLHRCFVLMTKCFVGCLAASCAPLPQSNKC